MCFMKIFVGMMLFENGDFGNGCYVVLEGFMKVFLLFVDGDE